MLTSHGLQLLAREWANFACGRGVDTEEHGAKNALNESNTGNGYVGGRSERNDV